MKLYDWIMVEGYQFSPKGAESFEIQSDGEVGVVENQEGDGEMESAWERLKNMALNKSSSKEKGEHPWMTDDEAEQVAKDHAALGESGEAGREGKKGEMRYKIPTSAPAPQPYSPEELEKRKKKTQSNDWIGTGRSRQVHQKEAFEPLPGYDDWKTYGGEYEDDDAEEQFEEWLDELSKYLPNGSSKKTDLFSSGLPREAFDSGKTPEEFAEEFAGFTDDNEDDVPSLQNVFKEK